MRDKIDSISFYFTSRGGFVVYINRGNVTHMIDYGFPTKSYALSIFNKFKFAACKLGNRKLFVSKGNDFINGMNLKFRMI